VLLDQVRDTTEIEFDIVPRCEGKNLFWIKRRLATGQLHEVTLKPAGEMISKMRAGSSPAFQKVCH
jgi:hypothetical protein